MSANIVIYGLTSAQKRLPIRVVDNGDGTGSLATSSTAAAPVVTPNAAAVPASTSGSIPAGAKGWTFALLSGTGTFGGVAVSAGFSDSDPNTTGSAIPYTTNASSTAYVRYGS